MLSSKTRRPLDDFALTGKPGDLADHGETLFVAHGRVGDTLRAKLPKETQPQTEQALPRSRPSTSFLNGSGSTGSVESSLEQSGGLPHPGDARSESQQDEREAFPAPHWQLHTHPEQTAFPRSRLQTAPNWPFRPRIAPASTFNCIFRSITLGLLGSEVARPARLRPLLACALAAATAHPPAVARNLLSASSFNFSLPLSRADSSARARIVVHSAILVLIKLVIVLDESRIDWDHPRS